MTTLKLKFKIEILNRILKYSTNEESFSSKYSDYKSKNYKQNSAKPSGRSVKIANSDFETLPAFEQEISKLQLDEKDELTSIMKNIDFSILTNIFTILQNKLFYNKLKSKIALEIIRQIFKEIFKNKSETECTIQQDQFLIYDECELFVSLKEILNIDDLDAMDLYDLFKFNEFSAVTEQHFIILIYLLASFECGNLEDFFQYFGDELFTFISGGENCINLSRLKDIGRILNIKENLLSKVSIDCNLDMNTLVDIEKFRFYHSILAKTFDNQFKVQPYLITNLKGKMNNQDKIKSNGCMNKSCNIL